MEFLIGITGPGYVLLASDSMSARSIMVLSSSHDKFHPLSPHQLLMAVGEAGESDRLRERLLAESNLAHLRMGRPWSTKETAHFTRSLMADSLRSRSPFSVQLLIAGVDEAETTDPKATSGAQLSTLQSTRATLTVSEPVSRLYWMDHLAALQSLPFAVHGYGAYFTWGLLDARYRANMTLAEAIVLLGSVLHELQTRFIMQMPKLSVKVIDAEGIKDVEVDWPKLISNASLKQATDSLSSSQSCWKFTRNTKEAMEVQFL